MSVSRFPSIRFIISWWSNVLCLPSINMIILMKCDVLMQWITFVFFEFYFRSNYRFFFLHPNWSNIWLACHALYARLHWNEATIKHLHFEQRKKKQINNSINIKFNGVRPNIRLNNISKNFKEMLAIVVTVLHIFYVGSPCQRKQYASAVALKRFYCHSTKFIKTKCILEH